MKKSDSGTKKSKPASKLSHGLFGSGSFDEDESAGDLFSPGESSNDLSTATPTVTTAAKATSGRSTKEEVEGTCMCM